MVVTELNSSKLFQIKLIHLIDFDEFDHYAYTQHSLIMKPEHKGAGC